MRGVHRIAHTLSRSILQHAILKKLSFSLAPRNKFSLR
jgi:hypothetical protein